MIPILNTSKLRGIIAERGLSQAKVAVAMGLTPRGFCNKLKKGRFTCDELERMVDLLAIKDPWGTLFADTKKGDQAAT